MANIKENVGVINGQSNMIICILLTESTDEKAERLQEKYPHRCREEGDDAKLVKVHTHHYNQD